MQFMGNQSAYIPSVVKVVLLPRLTRKLLEVGYRHVASRGKYPSVPGFGVLGSYTVKQG